MKQFCLTIICCLLLAGTQARAEEASAGGQPGYGDAYAAQLLSGLRMAYAGIEEERSEGNELGLKIQYDLAIQNLTGLSQLFGFGWARERLLAIYREPDCPDLHMGYSADRRIMLRMEPLELRNPAFAEYTIYLCTLESLHEADISTELRGQLEMELLAGEVLEAQLIEPGHALWEELGSQAEAFRSPQQLRSGQNSVFKQLYAVRQLGRETISAVSLDWDNYHFRLEWLENEVAID